MTTELTLHWSPDSANLVIRIALERFGLPYEAVLVDRARGAHHSAGYRALNPQGLIPVLEDQGRAIFETGAILLHLADRQGRFGPDGPDARDPEIRAAALPWLFYLSNTLHADLRVAFYAHRYLADALRPALIEGVRGRLAGHIALIEARLAERGGLLGAEHTVLEDYLGVCLRWARLYPKVSPLLADPPDAPALMALLARIETDAAVRRAVTAEHIPGDRALTAPAPPDLPQDRVTG